MLQVARYLLKNYNRVHRGSKKPFAKTVAYLKDVMNTDNPTLDSDNPEDLRKPKNLIQAFITNSCFRIKKAGEKILLGLTSGMDMKTTWDEYAGIELLDASTSHSYLWMINNFYEGVERVQDVETRKALMRLFLLYTIDRINAASSTFFESKAITADTFRGLRELR